MAVGKREHECSNALVGQSTIWLVVVVMVVVVVVVMAMVMTVLMSVTGSTRRCSPVNANLEWFWCSQWHGIESSRVAIENEIMRNPRTL